MTGLRPGVRYYFRIQSYTVVGDSPWVEVEAFSAAAPSAAGIPVVSPGDGSATVSWTPSVSDGGSAVTYLVERSLDGGLTWQVVAITTASSLTDAPLQNGVAVLYRVTATNIVGSASPSVSSPTTPRAAAGPDTPRAPVTPESPVPVAWDSGATLPSTGSNSALPVGALGGALLLLGAGAVILARRRETNDSIATIADAAEG